MSHPESLLGPRLPFIPRKDGGGLQEPPKDRSGNETSFDQQIKAITQPYAYLLANVAGNLMDQYKLGDDNIDIQKIGNRFRARWTNVKDFRSGEGIYRYFLEFQSPKPGEIQLGKFNLDMTTPGPRKRNSSYALGLEFDKGNDIEAVNVRWKVAKERTGPYEIMGDEEFGNQRIGDFIRRNVSHPIVIRDGETETTDLKFRLGQDKGITMKQRFKSDIGFDKTVFDFPPRFIAERININSFFEYIPDIDVFYRRFPSEKDHHAYARMNDSQNRINYQMGRGEFLECLGSFLRLIPANFS
jgi:hypothetical protein